MPQALVLAGDALARGVRNEFLEVYENQYKVMTDRLSGIADLSVPSDKLEELYVHFDSAPYPVRVTPGQTGKTDNFRSYSYAVRNHEFQSAVEWYWTDEEDDQTGGGIIRRAQSAGGNFGSLDERITFQVMTGTTDATLLPSIPTAPDGAALYSATTGGGANRFGVSGGNIFSGNGVANASVIASDVYSAILRMGAFKDTKNQPLLNPTSLQTFTIVYNIANDTEVRKAFEQNLIFQTISSTGVSGATSGVVGAAAPTNFLRDFSNLRFNLYPSQRVTGDDIYVFCSDVNVRPIFVQQRSQLVSFFYDMTKDSGMGIKRTKRMDFLCRKGAGVTEPYATVKIDNS